MSAKVSRGGGYDHLADSLIELVLTDMSGPGKLVSEDRFGIRCLSSATATSQNFDEINENDF